MSEQLPLFDEIESVPSVNALSDDERLLMFTLGAKGGATIPIPALYPQVKTLKRRGLVRDSLLHDLYIELTALGEHILSRHAEHQLKTGQVWVCRR